ncbi:VOC family protein [Sphingomonas sp. S2-65]|uniref:VOC family protein n=1 Tax=Sphingomonas sp. S2-65 TaxID=2903960 RepID=UPI001F32B5B7|nr:VOC family protein [Sphingomonas sp. S2-65]UYY58125.1 VOC family protein [Sphingomonas sp. S2-65]
MSNPHGTPIWYELITGDPDAAQAFYTQVVGWSVSSFGGTTIDGPGDYRILSAADGQGIGGLMRTPAEAPPEPRWFGYIGVDDVDTAFAKVTEAGGSTLMPPTTLDGVGRLALVADPQGAPFYLMRGESPEPSHAFDPKAEGHCTWHELTTGDDQAALTFYGEQFGWSRAGAMPMGEMGDYSFLALGDVTIGAVMRAPSGERPSWQYYFRVGDIDAAHARIKAAGGIVHMGPMEVPGGDWIVVASDPQGARFGLVGSKG